MPEKDFFISSIPLVDIQGSKHIPTVLFYKPNGGALIGIEAKSASASLGRDSLNEDFKIDLGNDDPSLSTIKRQFPTADGKTRGAGDLTGEFLFQLMRYIRDWLPQENISETAGIVIAEPISMSDDEVVSSFWLSNYRSNIRRILLGRGFSKEQIDFLPEPFAVYQYYKYKVRHGLLSGSSKHAALVIDFGGGSFDVCIIKTDQAGEITTKRKNTRPIAASSAPIGGFFVNKCLAELLYLKYAKGDNKEKTQIRDGIEVYNKWRNKNYKLSEAKDWLQYFVKNFHNTIYDLEDPKLALCNSITNWELDSPLLDSVQLKMPRDPFQENSIHFIAELTASEFRDMFVKKIWGLHLEKIIKLAIERGKQELLGEPLTIVLLSGGSCNIRWLGKLLKENLSSQLNYAQILEQDDDFQEVVAKGVAVECTRRFYDDNNIGDFTSVTYNQLNLILDPDEKGLQLKIYQPTGNNPIPATEKRGVLLPSASKLRDNFDIPLNWKVRLDSPPKQKLDYYFLRSGLAPHKITENKEQNLASYSDELLNLDHRVNTPPNCPFDSTIQVELKIEKETKTARVRFIYAKENNGRKCFLVDGKPFHLDMTDTQDSPKAKAYIGLDFGTSNTAVSYVSQSAVKTYEKRSTEKHWVDLGQLHKVLPYPLAIPLAKYLSESFDQSNRVKYAREFVEASLAMAAYISYLDMCNVKNDKQTKVFKGFTQRSVGPLWALLKHTQKEYGKKLKFTTSFKELVTETFEQQMDDAVTYFGQNKHEKADDKDFNPKVINILANACQAMFTKYQFGYFENVQQQRFKNGLYKGIFRLTIGDHSNFSETIDYTGTENFINRSAYLVNFEDRIALPLSPLIFWYSCSKHSDEEHCYFYDKPSSRTIPCDEFSFKAAGFSCSLNVTKTNEELEQLADEIGSFWDGDPKISTIKF